MKTYKVGKGFIAFLCISMCNSCTSHNVYSTKSYISCSLPLLNNEFSTNVSFQGKLSLNDVSDDFCILPISEGIMDIKDGAPYKLIRIISNNNFYLVGSSSTLQNQDSVILPNYYDSTFSNVKSYFNISDEQIITTYSTFESILLYLGNIYSSSANNISNSSSNTFTVLPEPFATRAIQNVSCLKIISRIDANEYFGLFIRDSIDSNSYLNNYLKQIDDTLKDLVVKDCKEVGINLINNTEAYNLENFGMTYDLLKSLQIGKDNEGNITNVNKLGYVYPNPSIEDIKLCFPEISEEMVHNLY